MMKLRTLAVTVALTMSVSLYACENHADASHGHWDGSDPSAQAFDPSVDASHDWLAAAAAGPSTADLVAAREALAARLTADEDVIEIGYDADETPWALVLGGYCEADDNCVQYTRRLSLAQPVEGSDEAGPGEDLAKQRQVTQDDGLSIYPKALPNLHMAYVVIQAQVEPFRGNQPGLNGDPSVKLVQQALNAKNISTTVDGWYGNGTTAAYATWQRRLGFTGLDATGIPGPTSLTSLGQNRFVVTNRITVGSRTTFSGKAVNQRTRSMLLEAQRLFGRSITVTQGSYNAGGVSASAGTHGGGGVVDISVSGLSETQRWQLVRSLRRVGFAAWYRTPSQGPWNAHIHAVAIGDTDMSLSARNQVADYYVGKNGLANHAADNTPSAYRVAFTWWEKYN
ncbi:putative peptidoglycan binding protein [Pseudofulvimonas gallinarii]|uniref:Putative peptidoglycan binding protein n=2 Tax=Pseudofulvimonas gallinarii TaxID=634155 RepID=A0A4R3L2I5_9GAMM|nr:putative peptidoglycan binding protein [Pseudofulvimonas gallinarii]